jgi:hypothetical protein
MAIASACGCALVESRGVRISADRTTTGHWLAQPRAIPARPATPAADVAMPSIHSKEPIMKLSFRQIALVSTLLATAAFPLMSQAQDVRREDRVLHFLDAGHIDVNKDGMVSKKEFMDAMSKTWDEHMGEAKKADPMMPKDKMTLQQYLEFSKMFGLNIGA